MLYFKLIYLNSYEGDPPGGNVSSVADVDLLIIYIYYLWIGENFLVNQRKMRLFSIL